MSGAKGVLAGLVLLGSLTGCLQTSEVRTVVEGGSVINGVDFPVPLRFNTSTPSGIHVYRVGSLGNASFHISFEYEWNTADKAPFSFTYILDDGYVLPTFIQEYPLSTLDARDAPGFYVGAGPVSHSAPEPAETVIKKGVDFLFTEERNATLIVVWSNLTRPAHVEAFWMEGATVTLVGAGDNVSVVDETSLREGPVAASTPFASAARADRLTLGSEDVRLFGIMRLSRITGEGELVLRDDDRLRGIPLDRLGNEPGDRYVFTANGPIDLSAQAVGSSRLRFALLVAELPAPYPAFDVWHQQAQTY